MSELADTSPSPHTAPPPADEPLNEVVRTAELPTQQLEEGRPTHAVWREDSVELVYLPGYTGDAPIEELPKGFWDIPMRADPVARTFAPDLEGCQAAKWAEVKSFRDQLEDGVAPTPLGPVQCDDRSKLKISGLVQLATIAAASGEQFAEEFTLADNQVVLLSAHGAIAMGVAVGRYVSAVHAASRALRALIYGPEAAVAEVIGLDVAAQFAAALTPPEPEEG